MTEEHRHTKTTISFLSNRFMFCLGYRRKLFLGEAVDGRFKEFIQEIGGKYVFKIVPIEADKDHCHLFVNVLPTYSPADIMNKVKGGTSSILRDEFAHLHQMPSLWTRSYFVSTAENVSSQTIKRYVESQRKR